MILNQCCSETLLKIVFQQCRPEAVIGRLEIPQCGYHVYRTVPVPGRPHLMSGNISSLLSNVGEHDYC